MLPLKTISSDYFYTPEIALIPLLKHIPKHWKIWECAAGKGHLVRLFHKHNYDCFGTDILDKDNSDFLKYNLVPHFDCIVTNPPYSLKKDFLIRAYDIGKPFAFLLPLTALETNDRQRLFEKYGLQIILMNKRINFYTPSGKGSGSWFATAWFTNGLNLKNQLVFEKIEKNDLQPELNM